MKQIASIFLLTGIFLGSIDITTRADVLDNWTTNQITTNSFGLNHVVYGNNIFVAVGEESDSGGFYTSADGFHWTLQYSEPNSWGLTMNYSAGHFAGVGPALGHGAADVSADGTNWTTTLFPNYGASVFTPMSITYGHGLYVAVGSTNNVGSIFTSPDGITWTLRGASLSPGGPIADVAYGAGKFVAIGDNDGLEYTSITGTGIWAKSNLPGGNKISYANGRFFVPLTSGSNLLSADGINWTLKPTGLTNTLGAVFYRNGIFMAKCGFSITGSYLATSTDGINWATYAKPLPGDGTRDANLATDGTRLVTVTGVPVYGGLPNAYNGFVYTSDVLVGIRSTNAPAHQLALSGLVGRNYQIQSADELPAGPNDWRTNFVLQLPNTPYVWTDATATNSKRFYRGVLLP
jgi:hypothetical protein